MRTHRAETIDLEVPNGRIRAERTGPADAPLTLLVHGLSQNLRAWDWTVPALAAPDRQILAVDLRGRGLSDKAPPYGPDAHVDDLLAVAERCADGAPIRMVGWSMGALLGIRLAGARPGLIERLVLVDHAGYMDEGALDAVKAGLARLDAEVPAPEPYLDAVKASGVFAPWTDGWERFFRYELGEPHDDGVLRPRTDRAFCTADVTAGVQDDFRARWSALTMPVLLVRATEPLGGGLIVPDAEVAALQQAVPGLELRTVEGRNHYTVLDDPEAVAAIARFLAAG